MKKKRLIAILCAAATLTCALGLVACEKNPDPSPSEGIQTVLKDVTGVTFASQTVTYDGAEHQILISGTLPEGVSVAYANNKGTNVGTYNATATLSGTGYKSLVLNATLTIENDPSLMNITGVTFASQTATYDGVEREILISGTLPSGVSVAYANNTGTNAGVYSATAILSGTGYNPLTLNATLTIEKANITGIAFASQTATYDGVEREILIAGTLPAGVSVSYANNKGTNAGTYNATATLSGANYNSLVLNATLTIEKAEITGVTFASQTVTYDGAEHQILISGTLPSGVSVSYTSNKGTNAGTYTATVTLSGANYVTKTLTATLTVKLDLTQLAKTVWDSLCKDRPEPWNFIPQTLRPESIAYQTAPVSDFTAFVDVSKIGKKTIGKQFRVLYEGLTDTAKALTYFDSVSAVGASIVNAYQTYINQNESAYKVFEFDPGEAGGFHGKITLKDDLYELLIGNSTVSLELTYDGATKKRTGRIQATDGIALKYEIGENTLDLAIKVTIDGKGNVKRIHFTRNGSNVEGYYYEYTGLNASGEGENGVKTSAAIFSNATKLVVVSNKRELDDLSLIASEEVYNVVTGEYIGSEVEETVKSIKYDTLWFMLPNVGSELRTIRVEHKTNGDNLDTIYINDKTEDIKTKLVGGFSTKTASRRFDIEMKDVWYVVQVTEGGKVKYEMQKTSIPMLFVQKDRTSTFTADFLEKNGVSLALRSADITNITVDYAETATLFLQFKDKSTPAEVEAYIGAKNSYFNQ